jgi:hypothetical protein
MTNANRDDLQGEGNYTAAKTYNEKTTAAAKDKARIKRGAQEAKAALDSDGAQLEAAERKGEQKARQ